MIYDTPVKLCKLPAGTGTIIQGRLVATDTAYGGERSVYASRYWEAVQAGSQVDTLLELPLHRAVAAGDFAQFRGHVYEIVQAQFLKDKNGLPITVLSLRRTEANFDISEPA